MAAGGGGILARREMIGGLFAAGIIPTLSARGVASPQGQVEDAARQLADAMAALHGGAWRVHVDHLAGLAAVVRTSSA